MLESIGRWLLFAGIALALTGAALIVVGRAPGLGHLPGDLLIRREHVTLFVPLGAMILVSVLLTLVLNIIVRWRR
jgi:hypothetical protein